MWVPSTVRASRVSLRRSFSLLTAPFVLAILLSIFISPTTYAADAIWRGTELHYQDNQYQKTTNPPNRVDQPNEYEWRDSSTKPDTASVIYIGEDPADATSATLVTYEISGDNYRNPSDEQEITVTRNLIADDEDTTSSCTAEGVGWIVCPVANFIAGGVDLVYGLVESFLEVQTIRDNQNGVYQLWQLFRTIANVCFILVFLVILYSQITGAGFSNYNLKTMLPRLVLGAILVNVSFFICAIAVDLSNVIGYSVQSIFVGIRESLPVNGDITSDNPFSWENLAGVLLGGGAATAGVMGLTAATALSGASGAYLLIAALIPVGIAVLVAFVILAARQALMVVLTIISPLAFVAFILPGTNAWFEKWRKGFMTLLIFFPAFAVLFGGSQLAGTAIINTTPTVQDNLKIPMVLIGLTTMVAPLVITPFLIRFSSGVLGTIANITNNKSRGLSDRAKNWAYDKSDMHRLRKLSGNTQRQNERLNRFQEKINNGERVGVGERYMAHRTPLANRMDNRKRDRDRHKKQSEEILASQHDRNWERSLAEPKAQNGLQSFIGRQSLEQRTSSQARLGHQLAQQAEGEKASNQASYGLAWQRHLETEPGSRDRKLRTQAHELKGEAGIMDEQLNAQDERLFRDTVLADRGLRKRVVEAGEEKHRAEQAQGIVNKRSEANWENLHKTDATVRTRRLEDTELDDSVKLAQQEWGSIIEGIRVKGDTMPGLADSDKTLAASIKKVALESRLEGSAQEVAKTNQQVNYAKSLDVDTSDTAIKRAAEIHLKSATGIGDSGDAARVIARAKSTVSSSFIEDAKNIRNTMPYDDQSDPEKLRREFEASRDISLPKRLAMVWASAQNGNFGYEQSREMIRWYTENGGANGGRPSDSDLRDFKELVKVESGISEGDRALELFLNDGKNLDRKLSEFTEDMGTWNIKTSRFAQMGQTRQIEAIEVWKRSGKEGQAMLDMVRGDIRKSQLESSFKRPIKEALGLDVRPGEE